ncbi:MAG: Flp pilus assembly protein CpaB [Myxococcota bacterium]
MARETNPGSGAVRALIFLGLAVALGAGSFVALYRLITNYQLKIDEANRPEDMVMVIVAARDLYQGVTITEEDLYAVQIPPKYLPEGVFLSPEHVVGRIPRERILANEFVRADRLADPESGVGLNAIIPRGMRALSVSVSDGRALSGFLNPGNYVDVLVTITPESDKTKPRTETLLQAIFVLGVNSRMRQETADEARKLRGRNRPSVTLLVTADEAEKIAHAENMGTITLSLRNDLDVKVSTLGGVNIDDLRGRLQTKKVVRRRVKTVKAKPKKQCQEVAMVQGGQKKIMLVDKDGNPCE